MRCEISPWGLAVAGDGPQGQNPVIRGLKRESVVLLVDGMCLNSAQPQGANLGQTRVTFASDGFDAKADWLVHPEHLLSFGLNAWRMGASPDRYLASPTPASPLDATLRLVDRQDRVATVFTGGSENTAAGFATADIGLTYQWPKQSLRVGLKNLADKPYDEHLSEGVSGQEIQAQGRSLMLIWQGKF